MEAPTDYMIIGVMEAFAVLLLALLVLIFFNHRLRKRVQLLSTWLSKLKDSTQAMFDEINNSEQGYYTEHLDKEIKDNERLFEMFSPGQELTIHKGQEASSRAIALRQKFLERERAAQTEANDDSKLSYITETLESIVDDLKSSEELLEKTTERVVKKTEVVVETVTKKGSAGYPRVTPVQFNIDVEKLKNISEQQKNVIAHLLAERNAAETEVTIKVEELQRLERYIKESELCIMTLEDELVDVKGNLVRLQASLDENEEMKVAINTFSVETNELLSCIETLEHENEELRSLNAR